MDIELATTADLNAVLRATVFLEHYRFEVAASAPRECSVRVPCNRRLERPGGILSGMTIMGAADVAMWLAIMTVRGSGEVWVTSDMKTAFLRSGKDEEVICTARLLKLGKRSAYGTVDTVGANSGLLAHHVVSYARVAA